MNPARSTTHCSSSSGSVSQRPQPDGELHLRQGADRPLPRRRENQADYITLRDKGLNWGPTAYDLRHTFQAYGTVDCRSATAAGSTSITGC